MLARSLALDEKKRVEAFFRREDRERYVAAHGILRHVLGRYFKMSPELLEFGKTERGKPELAGKLADSGVCFNLAHSGDVVVLALARTLTVGIDVEEVRAGLDPLELAESQFAERELAQLRSLPPERLRGAFFQCWARKEAYLKARGDGLYFALNRFAVSVLPEQPPALLWADDDAAAAQSWRLFDLDLCAGYAASLATRGAPAAVVVRRWESALLWTG